MGKPAQNLRQLGLAELGSSACAGGQVSQAFDVFAGHDESLGKNLPGANMTEGIPAHF